MNKPKILLLIDGQGWVLDRIAYEAKKRLTNFHIDLIDYNKVTDIAVERLSLEYDLIHYQNWNVTVKEGLRKAQCPVIISVKSHRYPKDFPHFTKTGQFLIHTINPQLQEEFPDSFMIPDFIFDGFKSKEFRVGTCYQNEPNNIIYKGVPLIKEACKALGCKFVPLAGNKPPEKMREWYESLDLYVCASMGEGLSTPIMECLSLNKPVITTNVGTPAQFNIHKCKRTVESITEMISRFYTSPQVKDYYIDTWVKNWNQKYFDIIKQ